MGIFTRISDIISANLNDLTEGFEDPEMMLKQAVREMEQSIAGATQETAKVLAQEKLLAKELRNNEQQALDWQRKAETSVGAGDDGLARKALSRKQEHQKRVVALQDQLDLARESSQALKHQLEGMQAKLAEAKRTLATLSARKKAADFKKKMATSSSIVDAGAATESAFSKFDRLREKVERVEAEAEALAELNTTASSFSLVCPDEPCFSSRCEEQVNDELEALKNKLKKS